MKFKPAPWSKWNWHAQIARKWALRKKPKLEFFPLCFVPESSPRRSAD